MNSIQTHSMWSHVIHIEHEVHIPIPPSQSIQFHNFPGKVTTHAQCPKPVTCFTKYPSQKHLPSTMTAHTHCNVHIPNQFPLHNPLYSIKSPCSHNKYSHSNNIPLGDHFPSKMSHALIGICTISRNTIENTTDYPEYIHEPIGLPRGSYNSPRKPLHTHQVSKKSLQYPHSPHKSTSH